MRRLEDMVAIVTGGAGGIGTATAQRLAVEGAEVILADIDLGGAQRVAAGIVEQGGKARAMHLDLALPESITAFFSAALESSGGRLHLLHNNAAEMNLDIMMKDGPVGLMDVDLWDRVYAVNTRGTMLMIKAALPALVLNGGGSIVNMSSGAAEHGDLFRSAYASSKGAVNVLTRYVAAQYGKTGVRCNAIQPGLVLNKTTLAALPRKQVDIFLRNALTPYLGEPDDIAAMVAMLASKDGKYITGQIINVDGGITSHFGDYTESYEEYVEATDLGGVGSYLKAPTDRVR